MTVMTTISSTSVKPSLFFISPLPVRNTVDAGIRAARIDVEYVLAGLRAVGRARIAAQAPVLVRDRVARDAAQEIDLGVLRAGLVAHALHQHGERRGVSGFVG